MVVKHKTRKKTGFFIRFLLGTQGLLSLTNLVYTY